MKVDVVVAHYNENLDWLKDLDANTIYVYSKSSKPPLQNAKLLPNIGRESHTYLHHIVENYEHICSNPATVTVFLQGDISDHVSIKQKLFVAHMVKTASQRGKSDAFPWDIPSAYYRPFWNFNIHNSITKPCEMPFGPWFVRYVQPDFPFHSLKWYVAALFAVRNDLIARRSKKYYEALLAQHDHVNPALCHFFERAWWYIFGGDCVPLPAPQNNKSRNAPI